jgi:hypothetical protein
MRVTIHQPEHLPWLGLFHKINMVDVYVVLDNVQFRKNYFQNRNKIRTKMGWCWLTVPVKIKFGQLIDEVLIDNRNDRWKKKYWDTIYFSYKSQPFFNIYADTLRHIIYNDYERIEDLNFVLINTLLNFLAIKTKIVKASDLDVKGKGTSLLLDICLKTGATTYISGISGKEYLTVEDFAKSGIEVAYQEFHHPIYTQISEPFVPCMSAVDLLFQYGEKSLEIINGNGVPVMKELFL